MTLLRSVLGAVRETGCNVPTLSELEGERRRACDADHLCATGASCVDNFCQPAANLDCTPGATRACGETKGECAAGSQTCEAGTWGACTGGVGPVTEVCDGKDNDCDDVIDNSPVTTSCGVDAGVCAGIKRACVGGVAESTCSAASYGADYQAVESRCDGKDNDCDGAIDENLPPLACALTAGVCAGATVSCAGGQVPTCTAATYLAHDAAYQVLETKCDGVDNDCDGLTDSWAASQISDGGASLQRAVAAVILPGTGTAARADVLTLYEVGNRLVARTVFANSTSALRFPSVTVTSVQRAWAPALGSLGTQVAEAWFEELTGPIDRLDVALAGPAGEAIANGSPGVLPIALPGAGLEVRVGLTSTRIVLAYAYLDSPGASTSTVALASCPRQLNTACLTQALGPGASPSLLMIGDVALVTYESGGRLQLAKVNVATAVTVLGNVTFGGSNEHNAVLAGTLANLAIYSVVPGSPDSVWRRTGDCSGSTCDPTTFTVTPSWLALGGTGSALAIHESGSTRLLAWEETVSGRASAHVVNAVGALASLEVAARGRRPVPLTTGTLGFSVFFDTEAADQGPVNVVLERRFCGP